MSFAAFNLHPCLERNIAALGYETPTPIQSQAMPTILEGRDVLGMAQTGTGKTAAFALPILHRLQAGPQAGKVRALVISPTRELAEQTYEAFATLGRGTGLRGCMVFGGVAMSPQIRALRDGTEVAIACPGRLLDHLRNSKLDLSGVQVLVLDEADQMLDMGFLPGIREIMARLPKDCQRLLFSATMPPQIRGLADEMLNNPVTVEVGHQAPVETVSHAIYPVESHLKTKLLMALLGKIDARSVLVFTRTRRRAQRVGEQLEKAGYKATSLQGDLSQNLRRAAMNGFRDGTHQILVATDIAARGIDVSNVSHVINYDIPDTVDAYTHRIGRTGRATRTGDAFTMVTREDIGMIRAIESLLGSRIPQERLDDFDYGSAGAELNLGPANNNRNRRHQSQPNGKAPARRGAGTGQAARHQAPRAISQRHAGSKTNDDNGVFVPMGARAITLTSHAAPVAPSRQAARRRVSEGQRSRPDTTRTDFRARSM